MKSCGTTLILIIVLVFVALTPLSAGARREQRSEIISANLFLRRIDWNEHRTSNVQHRMVNEKR
jgi:hypothetical protein